jgi:hypothetical protein
MHLINRAQELGEIGHIDGETHHGQRLTMEAVDFERIFDRISHNCGSLGWELPNHSDDFRF